MDTVTTTLSQPNGIIEFVLFGGAVWFWLMIGIFFIIAVTSEARENGIWSFVGLVVMCIVLEFNGSVQWGEIFSWKNILMYLGIGLVFALIRTWFWARKKSIEQQRDWALSEGNSFPLSSEGKVEFRKSHYYSRYTESLDLSDNVFRWWFNWPFSAIWWIISDWWANLWDLMKNGFQRVAKWGFDSAM